MNNQELVKLQKMLHSLMGAQDEVTHMNEQGPMFEDATRILIAMRADIFKGIVAFVERLTCLT